MTLDNPKVREICDLIEMLPAVEQRQVFTYLRSKYQIHELENRLNVSAEIILEAISRASDLTLRGVRGIIAEAVFRFAVVLPMQESKKWHEELLDGDHSYDFKISDGSGAVTIQVKMQRQKDHQPMLAPAANKKLFSHFDDYFVVETQKTRGGKDNSGQDTRPYKFGDFDILAVALQPSTGDWADFIYTVGNWLIPNPKNINEIFKFQPVAKLPDEYWTRDIETAIKWLRSGEVKRISPAGRT